MILKAEDIEGSTMYKLLTACVSPRPIAWVSTRSKDGQDNLAPFSFFNVAGYQPGSLIICPIMKSNGKMKDTTRNILDTKVFAVHVVTEKEVHLMNDTSEELDSNIDEFTHLHIEKEDCDSIAVSRIKGIALCFECVLIHQHFLSEKENTGSHLLVGKILSIYADEKFIKEDLKIKLNSFNLVGKMGGSKYVKLSDHFEMKRK